MFCVMSFCVLCRRDIGLFVCSHFNFHACVVRHCPSAGRILRRRTYILYHRFLWPSKCVRFDASSRRAHTEKHIIAADPSSSSPSISCRAPSLVARLYPSLLFVQIYPTMKLSTVFALSAFYATASGFSVQGPR